MSTNDQQDTQEQDTTPNLPPAVLDAPEGTPADDTAGEGEAAPKEGEDALTLQEPEPEAAGGEAEEDPAAGALAALSSLVGAPPAQAQQQAPVGLDPRAIAELTARAVNESPANRLIAEALSRQARAASTPQPPARPGPDATVADWNEYASKMAVYSAHAAAAPLRQQIEEIRNHFGGTLQQIQQTLQQQQQQAQQQHYAQTLDAAITALSQRPSMAWMREDPLRATIVRSLWEQAVARDPRITLDQVALEVGRSFKVAPPAPEARAAQARAASTKALAAKRAQVSGNAVRPVAGGAKGKGGETNEQRLKRVGLWDSLPPDQQELHRYRDRQMN